MVELQILAKVLEKSKFCDVLTAFLAYDPKGSKADTVQEIAQLVSAVENLNYLEKKVNLNVRCQRSLQSLWYILICSLCRKVLR